MELQLFKINQGVCPYLENRQWETVTFFTKNFLEADYEELINFGFRRSGFSFYQNSCGKCSKCIPLRIDVNNFKISRSQKRVLNKNSNTKVTIDKLEFRAEDFSLYEKYLLKWHLDKEPPTEESYKQFLLDSPLETFMMRYYVDTNLVGIGWLDELPDSLSSVYFIFDPGYKNLNLGTYSILTELIKAKELKRDWLNLGFWVEGSSKMQYKQNFYPHQKLIKGNWISYSK